MTDRTHPPNAHLEALLDYLRMPRSRNENAWIDRVIRWHDHEPANLAIQEIRNSVRAGSENGHGLFLTPYWPEACLWAGLLDGAYLTEDLLTAKMPRPDGLVSDFRCWKRDGLEMMAAGFSDAVRHAPIVRKALAERFRGGLPQGGYPRPTKLQGVLPLAIFVSRDGSRVTLVRHPDVEDRDIRDIGISMIGWMLRSEKPHP